MTSTTSLAGRHIVLGVTGGVSAYKAVELCRELVRRGAFVSPIVTPGAEHFVRAALFSAVASEPARMSLWNAPEPSPHTTLGQRADLVVIAPATANVLAAAAAGLSGDLLTTTLLATRAPVLMCPAMHTEMWEHPATQANVTTLASRGVTFVMPERGELAGGDVGVGRLAEPHTIVERVSDLLTTSAPSRAASRRNMRDLRVLVSAGGTREPIDPVRFLGNRSSGRQGNAIAIAAAERGARVVLVTAGTVPDDVRVHGIDVVPVNTAQELHDAMLSRAAGADIIVQCAAVADFRPRHVADTKIKRRDGVPSIELEPTPNVLRALIAARRDHQTIVGFAAETTDAVHNATAKLDESGADLLVVNDVTVDGAGFESPTNEVTLLRPGAEPEPVARSSKRTIADYVLDAALQARD